MSTITRWTSGLNLRALAGFAVAFFVAHAVALRMISASNALAPAWPPVGITVAALLLLSRAHRPAILIIVSVLDLLSNALQGYTTWRGVAYLAVNLAEAVLVAELLGRFVREPVTFGRVRDISTLFLGATAAAAVGAFFAAFVGEPAGVAAYGRAYATWVIGDLLGMLLFTPLVVSWARRWQPVADLESLTLPRAFELLGYGGALVFGAIWCFRGQSVFGPIQPLPLKLALMLLWAALRLDQRGTTAASVLIAAVAAISLFSGQASALGGADGSERLLRVQVYIGLMALTGLIVSAALAEAREAAVAQARMAQALLDSERRLRQSQKMEAVGQLAGGIAHDFNNILAAILMQANEARTLPSIDPEAAELLLDVEASAQRAASLTRQLLLFSRQQAMQQQVVDLNDVVRNLARLLRRVVPESVQFQVACAPAPLVVRADVGMVEQVVMNLVVNARDAMPNGGQLIIETRATMLDTPDLVTVSEAVPGRYAALQVRDTGSGIHEEHVPHLFEPFFTTKEPGKGTGLGLSTVFGIAQQHRGLVRMDTTPGQGTTFEFLLPMTAEAITPLDEVTVSSSTPIDTPSPATVLVVEDDPAVRHMLQRVLERDGLRVLTAETGREALDEWPNYPVPIDMILTDIVMPGGISGIELARLLLERNPALRVVFTSGYDPAQGEHGALIEPGVNFLPKPSSPQQIQRVIRSQLRTGRAAVTTT